MSTVVVENITFEKYFIRSCDKIVYCGALVFDDL